MTRWSSFAEEAILVVKGVVWQMDRMICPLYLLHICFQTFLEKQRAVIPVVAKQSRETLSEVPQAPDKAL